ncbi:hypothetical protein BU23DRAFT_552612 [Bimuria novae-zelandiae CBS 107.79]|uniref:Uncharacterized protein n=1 Tax=Bimuria novae-zelandiae CBS 107.79 TaxID=1447943 RepID=A0A6A5VDH0_9PLEO|nr:hypothetical protein BU23DRAFT_552612 [Bimuria novae-zelandiae CBS 107.79]
MTFFQALLPQLDGPQDYRPRMVPSTTPHAAAPARGSGTSAHLPKTAYRDLLPYCTTEMPLNEQQVIGLSDVAGSLKEVMLLALRARMDERCAEELVMAVGEDAMRGIVDFFGDEFEI